MPGPRAFCFASPQGAEAYLAEKLQELTASGNFFRPALVVVPSRSVREGLVQALLRRRPAWLGVEVRTLHGVALALLQEKGLAFQPREELLPVVIRRVAQSFQERYPFLQLLTPLPQVWHLVSTVRDLLDAGFTHEHGEAAGELVESDVEGSLRERATAVLQVAAAVDEALSAAGVLRRNDALRQATHLLKTQEAFLGLARPVVVYGFADVTGLAADFLEAFLSASEGELLLVQPPDPMDPEVGAGEAFLSRLRQRVPQATRAPLSDQGQRPELLLWEAPELEAEVRWVAEDIKKHLAAGVKPEHIGVVARSLEPYAVTIRQVFSALGVPFSAYQTATALRPLAFRLFSLLALVAQGKEALVSELLAAIPGSHEQGRALMATVERLAAAGGARTVGQLIQRGKTALGEPGETEPGGSVSFAAWRSWLAQVEEVLADGQEGQDSALFKQKVLALAALCDPSQECTEVLEQALVAVEGQVGGFPLSLEERCFLLGEELRRKLSLPLGGNGGGVAVLSVMEARFRTFQRLYVMGLQRDVFPRVPKEDPLLPDHVRRKLALLLPDIPLAERGASEERYLFGLLLTSAPWVWLSWPAHDAEERPLARSPFVDELLVAYPHWQPRKVPAREALLLQTGVRPAPAKEWAVFAALQEDRQAWRLLFQRALEEARSEVGSDAGLSSEAVTEARARVLAEWAPPPWQAEKRALSPYLGFLGSCPWVGESSTLLAVTAMEAYAECPWKTFLERVLRLHNRFVGEAEGANLRPRLLGDVVHGVLEAILSAQARNNRGRREVGAGGESWSWPPAKELNEIAFEVARQRLQRGGVVYPGLVLALAAAAMPYIEVARRLFAEEKQGRILAGEGSGWVGGDGRQPFWYFRFDAAWQREGVLVLLDFKTGSPEPYLRGKTKPESRVRRGELLQGAMYAVATHGSGCYVFLRPDWHGERMLELQFSHALKRRLLATLFAFFTRARFGVFFPRLFDPVAKKEPDTCERCSMRLACSRGESAARRRLEQWGESFPIGGSLAALAWDHWWLQKEDSHAGNP